MKDGVASESVLVRNSVQFLLNDETVVLDVLQAHDTLLDYLRLQQRLTGTKEGCAEGDCGACTVLVGRLDGAALQYEPVNACIRFVASLDGCHVVTIEHLKRDGALHPIQKAMVDHHGSQCGFCTPGIVMALYALWMQNSAPTRDQVRVALQGNLCRCTGYAPILKAACAVTGDVSADALVVMRNDVIGRLKDLRDGRRVEVGGAILPADRADLAAALDQHLDATIVAGSTDVGLWVTKQMRDISPAIFIGGIDALNTIEDTGAALHIGAGVTYAGFLETLDQHIPQLREYWLRIGGAQVRAMGTIGGNIANGSPIGDTPPVLIALGSRIVLESTAGARDILLEDFFIDYGQQDLRDGEFVAQIVIPKLEDTDRFAAVKLSKRRDEDISTVAAGYWLTMDGPQIGHARLAYGGMAGTPKRARAAEAALIGQPFGETAARAAMAAMEDDFSPLTDMRGSVQYRMNIAQNLLLRWVLEQAS